MPKNACFGLFFFWKIRQRRRTFGKNGVFIVIVRAQKINLVDLIKSQESFRKSAPFEKIINPPLIDHIYYLRPFIIALNNPNSMPLFNLEQFERRVKSPRPFSVPYRIYKTKCFGLKSIWNNSVLCLRVLKEHKISRFVYPNFSKVAIFKPPSFHQKRITCEFICRFKLKTIQFFGWY